MHLERLTAILEVVGQLETASVAEICAGTDLPKASAYRLVQDLVGVGLLEPVARGRFCLGLRFRRIGQAEQSDAALIELVAPVLRREAATHGAAFFLSRLRGHAVEIIHVESPETGVSFLHPGYGKRPMHACSCSKAIAAFRPQMLAQAAGDGALRAYTDATLTSIEALHADLDRIRARGYAECVEEIERGMASVAAPLGTTGVASTVSIGAAGSTRVLTQGARARLGAELVRLAAGIAARLHWDDPEPAPRTA